MGVAIHGTADGAVDQVRDALVAYAAQHPTADVTVRRNSPYSIHIRVIDPALSGIEYFDRMDPLSPYLETLPPEVYGDITLLLMLTPEEAADGSSPEGWANRDFERGAPVGA
ncbi:MAG: hypothetical protein U0871_06445 [Gemmataceae bacterium]